MKKALSSYQMAGRIGDREDNLFDKRIIKKILDMYMSECRKALLRGERVQISGVGTIIPEVKTCRGKFNLPVCNKENGNPPYTRLKMSRCNSLMADMNRKIIENVENGIYGLEKLPFDKLQINNLIANGYITKDEEEDVKE